MSSLQSIFIIPPFLDIIPCLRPFYLIMCYIPIHYIYSETDRKEFESLKKKLKEKEDQLLALQKESDAKDDEIQRMNEAMESLTRPDKAGTSSSSSLSSRLGLFQKLNNVLSLSSLDICI